MANKNSTGEPARPRIVSSEPAGDGGPIEAAHFIRGTIVDLTQLARRHRLDMLGYLLDMAHLEASEFVRLNDRPK